MIAITPTLELDEAEIVLSYVRAPGPGGQNVNKLATAAQLRFDAANSPSLDARTRARLPTFAGRRMTKEGVIVITANRFRSQIQNREDAIARLVELLRQAAAPVVRRVATRPTRASRERRLTAKRHRSDVKRGRGDVAGET
jgi:ribosome-associated protein